MNPEWKGQRITGTLSISASPSTPDRWVIHEDDPRGKAVGSGEDMVRLARAILDNVDVRDNASWGYRLSRLDWLREYRRRNTRADLREAQHAWARHNQKETQDSKAQDSKAQDSKAQDSQAQDSHAQDSHAQDSRATA